MPHPTFDLTGKTAFLTGGSRGLGKGFALTLARAGCDLAITARSVADLAETTAAIEALDRKVLPLALDVRDHDSIRTATAQAAAHFGRIDILVNNASLERQSAIDT